MEIQYAQLLSISMQISQDGKLLSVKEISIWTILQELELLTMMLLLLESEVWTAR